MIQSQARVHRWVAERVPQPVELAIARIASAEDVVHVAIMPDVHLANDVCVGTVIATTRLIYPAAIGGDIGCGILAAPFNCNADLLNNESAAVNLLRAMSRAVPTMRRRSALEMSDELARATLSHPSLETIRRRDGTVEFATLGRGNHFIEFQADEDDHLWIMIHSGSRAMGPAIRDFHLRHARKVKGGLFALDSSTSQGLAFLHDLDFARRYAAASRLVMLYAVAEIMKRLFGVMVDQSQMVNCDHNHVRQENHFGQNWYVHRKGASRAGEDEVGLIPGSMGTMSFHTAGRGEPMSLCSSSHGAGRTMSRTEARSRISAGAFRQQMRNVWFDPKLADKLRDEAPSAYKDCRRVMRVQSELTRIVRRLRPILCYKGM